MLKNSRIALVHLIFPVLCFVAGMLVMDIARDVRDKQRLAYMVRELAHWRGAADCYPAPGQETRHVNDGRSLSCVIYEIRTPGLVPKMLMAQSIPALPSVADRGAP